MSDRSRVVAFDLDATSLSSLQEALPAWEIEVVNGATAASLTREWNPGAADLLVVKAREEVTGTLGLCRFLSFCSAFSTDSREAEPQPLGLPRRQSDTRRADAPLLVLVAPGQQTFAEAALEAGAHSCLTLPVHPKDIAHMLAHAQAGNRPGRHTGNLEGAQRQDHWRDEGGQG